MHRQARITLYGTTPIAFALFLLGSTCNCLLLHATWMTIAIAGLTGALTIEFLAPEEAEPA